MQLDAEHMGHLINIGTGGLMRIVTPDEVSDKLITAGYVRMAVGGLVITKTGHEVLNPKS